jgi:hypothetical protein
MRMWSAAHVCNVARVSCATCILAGAHDTRVQLALIKRTCDAHSCDLSLVYPHSCLTCLRVCVLQACAPT